MNGAGKRLPAPDDAHAAEAALVPAAKGEEMEAAPGRPPAISAMDRAVEEICEAVRAALSSSSINKFTEAARLCQIGHQLQRARAKSLDDFEKLAGDEAAGAHAAPGLVIAAHNNMANNYVVGFNGGYQVAAGGGEGDMAPIPAPRPQPLRARDAQGNLVDRDPGAIRRDPAGNLANEPGGGAGAAADAPPLPEPPALGPAFEFGGGRDDPLLRDPAVRRVMLAVLPAMQVQRAAGAAQAAESESEELKNLLEVRDKLLEDKRAAVDARIDALVESLETRVRAREQERASKALAAEMAAEGKANGKAPVVHPDVRG
ncbi:MAG TPA: hypothetical protein VMI75_03955 [Polyangiaceae bacterium]|nr:hypothetical protein [Polyangiaceae bacterium]